MADNSLALAAVFARAKYEAILAGVGPRRDQLLANEYQSAVFAVVRELAASVDIPLNWNWDPKTDPEFYRELDLSRIPQGWSVLGAVVQPSEFVWVIAVAPPEDRLSRWTGFYQFDKSMHSSAWLRVEPGPRSLGCSWEAYGPEVLSVALAKRLAAMSVARDLAREE
jgi:hypothetical protein